MRTSSLLSLRKLRSKRISRRVRGKLVLSLDRPFDLSPGAALRFGDAMRAHGGEVPREKIEK
jgi:hypothetical protein